MLQLVHAPVEVQEAVERSRALSKLLTVFLRHVEHGSGSDDEARNVVNEIFIRRRGRLQVTLRDTIATNCVHLYGV